ncbi:glycosyl hydrolase family 43 [Nonomuraea polychroma]|uniref:Glycosyl hydrolase family 43 n=1 Tax=Nonomuraea polychroma TaxID=46176 RepID=A0A438M8I9_9ACTN|nr:family 43 glycosylhydrolase [Nonomuraea polychroma]RVX42031.1 glycosyl hydrolase family 43 [Nonomuraea polychroma]
MRRRALACLAALAATVSLVVSPAQAAAADGPVLWYKLDEQAGAVAADSSGNARHGTVRGTAGWGDGLTFNGSDTDVKLPNDVMKGLDSITVSTDVLVDPGQRTPYFIYGFGNTSGTSGNGYLFATGNHLRVAVASGNWSTEQNTRLSTSHNLARGGWKHLVYTQTGTTGVLYEDGVEIGRNTNVTITPGSIGGGTTTANYLGRSLYSADRLFQGKLRDFRIYDRAISADEVKALAQPAVTAALAADKQALTLGDTSAVTADLTLPAAAPGGSKVTWATSDASVVTATGKVTRPANGQPPATATLTATLARGALTDTKTFEITVMPEHDDTKIAQDAAAALKVHGVDDVRGNLTLPVTGENGTTVSWASGKPSVITPTGEVTRPAHGAGDVTVTLTATVTRNAATATREFTAKVRELPAEQDYKGYLFSYFTGEGTADGEQVYFALSRGNDPLRWRELNGGKPVLTSTLGEKGLRDPFIIRSPEGDKFYQIATDLRIFGNGNWDAAQRTGSKSIMVWESTDLVNWGEGRLVKVSPDTAGNTWAPEAYYDETLGAYVVFWASKLYAADDPNHTGNTYNRMMYATTRDFRTFSEPKVWVDPGYSVIDSTVIKHGGTYYRYTKDERNNSSTTPCSKFILAETSTSLLNTKWDFLSECIGKGAMSQGEGPTIFKSNDQEKWYLFIDEFGGRGYIPFESTNLASGTWTPSANYSLPARPRHGTVIGVTQAEYDRLLRAYAPGQLVESAEEVKVVTGIGDAPILPEKVTATFADGSTGSVAVTWDEVPASAYAQAGTFTVQGTLPDGASVRAKATVTVSAEGVPVESLTVSPAELRLGVGVSRQVKAVVEPTNATARQLTWTSADPSVATVSATGLVTTVKAGTTEITVRTADGSRTVTIPVEATAAIPADLLLHYTFDEKGGTVARDASGRGNDGSYERTPAWGDGVHGASFQMAGGAGTSTTAPYVTIPNGVLKDVSDVTVAFHVKWNASTTANQWIYGFGPDRNKYLFTGPRNGAGVLFSAITTGSWQAESSMRHSAALPGGAWKHVAVTLDSAAKTMVMYLDGVEIARVANVTVKPSDLYDAAKSYGGYIGRSLYAEDPYFAGEVDDFRVYGRALPAAEVYDLGGDPAAITGVTLPQLKVDAIVEADGGRITLPLKEGSDVTKLAPQLTLAPGAAVSPASGAEQDFTEPVTYTVTGADGTKREWKITALVMKSPVLPGLYADPNLVVFGDRFYLYPTTDGFAGWSGTQFTAFSSTDLVHWTDHGVILDLGPDVSWADNSAWAPAIAEKDGKYYFYFSGGMATGNTAKHLGVAVADSPTGPFRDALGKPLVPAGTYSGQMIDPAVFQDDDGQHYLYWGNGNSYQVPLNADMVSFDAAKVKTYKPAGYNEGSFVVKRDGTYYFMWSENDTRSEDYQVAYATGETPLGPWTKRGVILRKNLALGIKGTGHHSVIRVPGTDDWYIAYHRFAIPGGDGTHRETTIDRLEFGDDGLIKAVTPTLESVDPVAVVTAGPDASGAEGAAIALTGAFSGAGTPAWRYEAADGAEGTCVFADPGAPRTTVTCTDEGAYRVTLAAGRSRDTATVTVANADPDITRVSGPQDPVAAGKPVQLAVTYTDPGTDDTLTCQVDWTDGTTGPCAEGHVYTKSGIYQPVVTVGDGDGGKVVVTADPVVVYDPKAGFVTGGGWIDSPAGAQPGNPAATGKAAFGFVSAYHKDATRPAGQTMFAFPAGGVAFVATHYDWLVVTGGEVRYRGVGKVNGKPGYAFTVTASDGSPDRFQIRIWKEAGGEVVYDNHGTDIGGGEIVVHPGR